MLLWNQQEYEPVSKLASFAVTPSTCKDNNGDCTQFCKEEDEGVVCSCVSGYALDDDNKTCVPVGMKPHLKFILLDTHHIFTAFRKGWCIAVLLQHEEQCSLLASGLLDLLPMKSCLAKGDNPTSIKLCNCEWCTMAKIVQMGTFSDLTAKPIFQQVHENSNTNNGRCLTSKYFGTAKPMSKF